MVRLPTISLAACLMIGMIGAGCGNPPSTKITDDDLTKIAAAAAAQPLSGRQLLALHVAGGGVPVSQSTLTAALKLAGMVWKRTRHSLKKSAMKPPSE